MAFELPPSSWCGTLKRLGTRPRWSLLPSAPDAGVQLEEYDSRLPGTDRPARTPPAPNQGCHRREAPARGPRCSVSRPGPGSRQLGEPARTQDRRSFPTRTPAARAGSVGKPAVRRQVKPPQLDSNGVPSSSTASTQPILPAVGLGRGHELPVETPTLPVPTPRAPTRTGPAIPDIPLQPHRTLGLAPGTDPRTLGPMRRSAMTDPGVPPFDPPGLYPRAKNVHGLDDPGITSRSYRTPGPHITPLTPSRAAHPAFNAQPGR